MKEVIDIIVVGGGHAGSEAALVAARMGASTLLITGSKNDIAKMPCNPSIGGLAKSHLVYELDALGGEMGYNTDQTALQEKTLNTSRGPAVRATRAQCDKRLYSERMQNVIHRQENLEVLEDVVTDILTENDNILSVEKVGHIEDQEIDNNTSYQSDAQVAASCVPNVSNSLAENIKGVRTELHGEYFAKAVIITSGTSLRGRIFIGHDVQESGGDNRPAANLLSRSLEKLGFQLIRLKTGTPPRLKSESCDFSRCIEHKGESPAPLFSLRSKCSTWNNENLALTGEKRVPNEECSTWNNVDFDKTVADSGDKSDAVSPSEVKNRLPVGECSTWNIPNISCWMTHTTLETHDIIRSHLADSALYGGPITGTGVRYCPSIEDKIVRFKDAEQHHVMLEPEDMEGKVIYPNGLSCSLPRDVQERMVRSVPGLENAEFLKYAYAIEYDGIDARELRHTLESTRMSGLFFAGQVNGTTG